MAKKNTFKLPRALTEKQVELIKAIDSSPMVITTGPAGSGKTYVPTAYAAYYYHIGKVDKIILTRPTVPVSRSIGFLPGTLEEKLMPWTMPFIQVLTSYLSKGEVDCMMKNGKLEIIPFETIRGHTFTNAFVILDEAQNTTIEEAKAFVTRLGENVTVVVNGDTTQSDLKDDNGLEYLCNILLNPANEELAKRVKWINFGMEDIVRSGLCRLWVKAIS